MILVSQYHNVLDVECVTKVTGTGLQGIKNLPVLTVVVLDDGVEELVVGPQQVLVPHRVKLARLHTTCHTHQTLQSRIKANYG